MNVEAERLGIVDRSSRGKRVQLPLIAESVHWDETGAMVRTPIKLEGQADPVTKIVVNDVWNGPVPDSSPHETRKVSD